MIKKNFSFFIIKNRSNGKIRYNRIRHPRNHSPMVREKVLIPCMLTQESIPRKVKTILHAGIVFTFLGMDSKKSKNNSPRRNSFRKNIVDGMALEKEKQEINNVKYIKGNQDAQKSFLIIFCEAEVLLRGIGETGTG